MFRTLEMHLGTQMYGSQDGTPHTQGLSAADQLLLTELLPTQSPWKNDVT